jgi:23S rRNA (cytosine1962-C5)-methyltransferase
MNFFNAPKVYQLRLKRDLTKHLKQGNPWVFSDGVEKISAPEGAYTVLLGARGEALAQGFYSPSVNLSFRALGLGGRKLKDEEILLRLKRALENKQHLLTSHNQCLRLINGEGDELPGVVADYYQGVVVLKLDGPGAEGFWNKQALAQFFMSTSLPWQVSCVYYKRKNREEEKGFILEGQCADLGQWEFLENGVKFRTNIIDAAKTGFFLDQRENRQFVRQISQNKTILNLFGYTGGFSVYAGLGGARKVSTVDIAPQAIRASEINWMLNHLPSDKHEGICADAFEFVLGAREEKRSWDLVITDPPSFAPNQKALENAQEAYIKVFSDSLKLVKDQGHFIASSCSGHIDFELFLELIQKALSRAKCRGKVLSIRGQPEDHPFPMALREMRYLKFVYLQVFKDT